MCANFSHGFHFVPFDASKVSCFIGSAFIKVKE